MVHVPRVSNAVSGCLSGGGYELRRVYTVPPMWSRYGILLVRPKWRQATFAVSCCASNLEAPR